MQMLHKTGMTYKLTKYYDSSIFLNFWIHHIFGCFFSSFFFFAPTRWDCSKHKKHPPVINIMLMFPTGEQREEDAAVFELFARSL